jgi:hypothetical protein
MTTATDDPTCRAILLDLLGTLDAIQRRDALGAPRVVDGHTLTLAERIVWRAKDEAEATDLWVGCLLDRLRAGGVTADQVKAAREWADHVLSK